MLLLSHTVCHSFPLFAFHSLTIPTFSQYLLSTSLFPTSVIPQHLRMAVDTSGCSIQHLWFNDVAHHARLLEDQLNFPRVFLAQ